MSSKILSSGHSAGTLAKIPTIKTFQMDGNVAQNTVNLFRGDINLPLELVSLSGRDGLDIKVAIMYQSNVQHQIDTWNLDAPTGILGLGWSMPYEQIVIDNKKTGSIYDDEYYLIANGSAMRLHQDGAGRDPERQNQIFWTFEIEDYKPWEIRYYPLKEEWVIVKENGLVLSYGGKISEPPKNNPLIQWGVKWGGANGNWIGSSTNTSGQEAFALAWNLAEITNTWGETVKFEYEADLAQVGGTDGFWYTRGSYLKEITAIDGRIVTFAYKPKDEIEYTIPHIEPEARDLSLHAYQDRYETKFLDSLTIRQSQSSNNLLFSVNFEYELKNVSSKENKASQDFEKRYLKGIVQRNAEGKSLPGYQFTYYWLIEDIHRGALKSITNPSGGISTFTYQATPLEDSSHKTTISISGIPRVWFGADYVVVTDYNESENGSLKVSVYTWNGSWVSDDTVISGKIEIDSLALVLEKDFFGLSFKSLETQTTQIYLFHQVMGRFHEWDSAHFDTLETTFSHAQTHIASGSNFVVACISGGTKLGRYVWNQKQKWWDEESLTVGIFGGCSLAALDNFFVFGTGYETTSTTCNFKLHFLNEIYGDWDSINLGDIQAQPNQSGDPQIFWSLSQTFATATSISSVANSGIEYQVQVYQWDKDFKLTAKNPIVQWSHNLTAAQKEWPLVSASRHSLVANLGKLWRYNGSVWQDGGLPFNLNDGNPKFAYDSDLAIVSTSTSSEAIAYDPYQGKWGTCEIHHSHDRGIILGKYKPTIRGNFITIGNSIFYRNSSGVLEQDSTALSPSLKPDSIINLAPHFILGETESGTTELYHLRNGKVIKDESFPDQRVYVDSEKSKGKAGTYLAGLKTFATYQGEDFNQSKTLTLHHHATMLSDEGKLTDFPVVSVTTHDGYQERHVSYDYDSSSATWGFNGIITQYSHVTVVQGSEDQNKTPFGKLEHYFLNGQQSINNLRYAPYYYSLLNGSLYTKISYDSIGNKGTSETQIYDVITQRQEMKSQGVVFLYGASVQLKRQENILFDTSKSESDSSDSGLLKRVSFEYDKSTGLLIQKRTDNYNTAGQREVLTTTYTHGWEKYSGLTAHNILAPVVQTTAATATFLFQGHYQFRIDFYNYNNGNDEDKQKAKQGIRKDFLQGGDYHLSENIEVSTLEQEWLVLDQDNHVLYIVKISDLKVYQYHATSLSINTWSLWESSDRGAWLPTSESDESNRWAAEKAYQLTDEDFLQNYLIASSTNSSAKNVHELVSTIFDAYWHGSEKQLPESWLLNSQISARAFNGAVLEAENLEGVHSSSIFDRMQLYPVAQFVNASLNEATYIGFEAYEDLDTWTLIGSEERLSDLITDEDAHTGLCSLKLSQPTVKLQKTFVLSDPHQAYRLCCWIKVEGGEAEWQIHRFDQSPIVAPIEASEGKWKYWQTIIPSSSTSAAQLVIEVSSKTATSLLIDDISFVPLLGGFQANIYDSTYKNLTAKLGNKSDTMRYVYDNFQRLAVTVGPDENVKTLTVPYYSRQGSEGFTATDPNSLLSISARNGGLYDNFQDGQWQDQWQGNVGAWQVENGALLHKGTSLDTLTLRGSDTSKNYGVRVKITPPAQVSHPIAISIGSSLTVRWQPTKGWQVNGQLVVKAEDWHLTMADWVLAVVENSVLFYVGGKQLSAQILEQPISGALSFSTGDSVSFQEVCIFHDPLISMAYLDGSEREKQAQLLEGVNCLVNASIYDALGRGAVETKTARYEHTLFGFKPEFVKSGWMPTVGSMEGFIATCYPNDDGYPFSRQKFEASPLSRVVEKGQPGQDFAITHEGNSAQNHTVQYTYGINNNDDSFADLKLLASEYFVNSVIDPDGVKTCSLIDKAGRLIAKRTIINAQTSECITFAYEYDAAGRTIGVKAPNYFAPPEGSQAAQWISTREYDFLGRLIESKEPDLTLPTKYIYDRAGKPRFMQDANGAAADTQYILYSKYDRLGRPIEKGYVEANWDEADLKTKANDATWPPTPPTWREQIIYDDGSVFSIGSRSKVLTNNGDKGESDVEESFTYDVNGNILQKKLRVVVGPYGETTYTTQYEYDSLGNVTKIIYPDGNEANGVQPTEVTYSYNHQGLLKGIGSSPNQPNSYVAYTYNADGTIQAESFYGQGSQPIQQNYHYNSPGWITQISSKFFSETLHYTTTSNVEQKRYNGNITSIENAFHWNNALEGYSYGFEYDKTNQLKVAQNNKLETGNLGVGNPISYDANGNFVTVKKGNHNTAYTYDTGTNRFHCITKYHTVSNSTYAYDSNGNIISSVQGAGHPRDLQSTFTYDALRQLPTLVLAGDAHNSIKNAYTYGGNNQRVLKEVSSTQAGVKDTTLYVRGLNAYPLLEKSGGGHNVLYIYGLGGLLAMKKASELYYILKDHLGSTRVVLNISGEENTVVASYDYSPFGDLLRTTGNESIISYRYTGQEYDDETGLYNYRARLYEPILGRFYSVDPERQFFSPYLYTGNNPINFVDPSGEIAGLIGAIIFAGISIGIGIYKTYRTDSYRYRLTKIPSQRAPSQQQSSALGNSNERIPTQSGSSLENLHEPLEGTNSEETDSSNWFSNNSLYIGTIVGTGVVFVASWWLNYMRSLNAVTTLNSMPNDLLWRDLNSMPNDLLWGELFPYLNPADLHNLRLVNRRMNGQFPRFRQQIPRLFENYPRDFHIWHQYLYLQAHRRNFIALRDILFQYLIFDVNRMINN